MAPGITYDNVPTEDTGTLFEGLKFWIGHRVPQRARWIDQIKQHGGEVVQIEKKADMIIGDCARKDQPPASYSWKFIETSVRNGVLHDKEDFLIGGTTVASRPVGASQPRKKTRTIFTQKDDQILAAYVSAMMEKSFAPSGNQIYMKLEKTHPNHTWQSWRDRWVSKLSRFPTADLARMARAGAEDLNREEVEDEASSPKRLSANGRVAFTEEDDIDFLNYREKGLADGLSLPIVCEMLAADKPHHTARSWRSRWDKILKARFETGKSVQNKTSYASQRSPAPALQSSRPNVARSPLRAVELPPEAGEEDNEEDEGGEEEEVEEEVTHAADEMQTAKQSRDGEALTAEQRRKASAQSDSDSEPEPGNPASRAEFPAIPVLHKSPEQQFYQDWQTFFTALGIAPPACPTFADKSIGLWDLYRAATSFDPDHRDWAMIARNLGLNMDTHPAAPHGLQKWYSEHMELFEEDVADAAGESSSDGSSDEGSRDEEAESPWPSIELDAAKSSSPALILKRKIPTNLLSTPSQKRAKYARDDEVPSTPDEILGIQESLRASLDKALGRSGALLSSPLKNPTKGSPRGLPSFPRLNDQPGLEPEPRDFQMGLEDDDDQGSLPQDVTPTPSQQLLTESVAATPSSPSLSKRAIIEIPDSPPELSEKARGKQPVRNDNLQPLPAGDRRLSPRTRRVVPASFLQPKATKRVELSSPLAMNEPRAAAPTRRAERSIPATAQASFTVKPAKLDNSLSVSTAAQNSASATPQPDGATRGGGKDLSATIEHFVSLGYAEDVVIKSLLCSNMEIGLAGIVMEKLSTDKGIPQNREGIWTAKDDARLKHIDSFDFGHVPRSETEKQRRREAVKMRGSLEYKHGDERMEQRRQFMAARR